MPNKRTKKRNLLTTNLELTELAYVLHISAIRLRETLSAINVPMPTASKLVAEFSG